MERKSQRSTRGLGPDVVGDPRVRERLEERVAVGGVEEVAIDRDGGRGGHRSASLQDVPYSKLLPAVPLRLRLHAFGYCHIKWSSRPCPGISVTVAV